MKALKVTVTSVQECEFDLGGFQLGGDDEWAALEHGQSGALVCAKCGSRPQHCRCAAAQTIPTPLVTETVRGVGG